MFLRKLLLLIIVLMGNIPVSAQSKQHNILVLLKWKDALKINP